MYSEECCEIDGTMRRSFPHLGAERKEGRKRHTLLGSLTSTYLPSGIFMQRSVTVRTMPHPLANDTFNWAAKSRGLIDAVDKITWRVLSRGVARDT